MRFIFLVLVSAILSVQALAADTVLVPTTDNLGCRTWVFPQQLVQGYALASNGKTAIIRAGNEYTWSAWATNSTSAEAWTVTFYDRHPGGGSHATLRATLNDVALSLATTLKVSWNGEGGDTFAVIGGADPSGGGGGYLGIHVKGCPLVR